ncbi:TetR/AcrR family transcriptional regulator [Sporolactobacillus sp. CQH2019]|uniref:TetR/AcrR family transcriptional regulator n=1 Tax=Sporolactobacillus sp. CQH2019 TaxID=3023512 RepID=UPI0023685018|nr:TetR/AcrR family transcriptional regulator [Sporolactobacillus sp. CQH2019]MDD9150622.1 TetR/AcrR family transcriptional regulator [Sporolactobacillus sp. CQH2019]
MKHDRRFLKTEQQIIDVFITLLNEKGFNQLTVRDIANRADINRATFYQHYSDKYELIRTCEERLLRSADRLTQPMLEVDIRALYHSGRPLPGLETVLNYYKENRMLLLGLLESGEKPSVREKLMAGAQKHIECIAAKQFSGKLPYPMHYITAYLLSAHFSLMLEWLKNGTREPVEEIARLITRLTLFGTIHGLNLD